MPATKKPRVVPAKAREPGKPERQRPLRSKSQPRPKQDLLRQNAPLAKQIGARITRAREGLGLSQQAVHTRTRMADPEHVGVSRAVLSLYERGINRPGAREIVLLCEVLKVTPNWLLFEAESPARAMQASLDWTRGSDLELAARLSFAMLALDEKDRDSFVSLSLSLLERKLGDIKLSALMSLARECEKDLLVRVRKIVGKEAQDLPMRELLDKFVARATSDGFYTNWGTLRPAIHDDNFDPFDPATPPPPPRKL